MVLVDIRPLPLRQLHGEVPDSLVIARSDLEFRFDPRNVEEQLSIANRLDLCVTVLDQDVRAGSLSLAAPHGFGLLIAIIGSFVAWKEGFPASIRFVFKRLSNQS